MYWEWAKGVKVVKGLKNTHKCTKTSFLMVLTSGAGQGDGIWGNWCGASFGVVGSQMFTTLLTRTKHLDGIRPCINP